ncbi:hypothetical protein C6A77_03860 [Pseudomonas sp. AFG_SD02_1510_Pfu_092]|nr:hypothetical protein C6A77_03860 [Pseudomonas sp. AFG_SD02_1510_Pfu_092]
MPKWPAKASTSPPATASAWRYRPTSTPTSATRARPASPPLNPVGAGSPANASVSPPSHSRVNPLPQGHLIPFCPS